MLEDLPVIGVCGWSGAGKTTLIEAVLPNLLAKGLKVIVVKHDAHGLDVDRPGKDSDRFFQAGADVLAQDPDQSFLRTHTSDNDDLEHTLRSLAKRYDLVIVEGHKKTCVPKIWLLGGKTKAPPPNPASVLAVFDRDEDRPQRFLSFVNDWLAARQ